MIAHYTRRIMEDYARVGWSAVTYSDRLTSNAARSRLQNAAKRAGVKVRTEQQATAVIARVVKP